MPALHLHPPLSLQLLLILLLLLLLLLELLLELLHSQQHLQASQQDTAWTALLNQSCQAPSAACLPSTADCRRMQSRQLEQGRVRQHGTVLPTSA